MELHELTQQQAEAICVLANEPFLSFMTNHDGKWKGLNLAIQIETTSTVNGNKDDSCIWIYYDGTVRLWRNNGDWGGSRDVRINSLKITDYLRQQGYSFTD